MPNTDPIFRPSAVQLIEMIRKLERRIRVLETSEGIFEINNENTPATLGASQNNYDPGNYDILRLSSSAAYNITGISGGVKGRSLRLINVGSYVITLAHENASSTAANRIKSSSENNVVVYPNAFEDLYYDSTLQRWTLPFSFRITNRQGGSSSNWNTVGTTNYDLVAGGKVQVGAAEIVIVAAQTGSVTITYPSAYTNPPWANISRRFISADLGAGDYVADFGIGTITNTQMTIQIGLNAVATTTVKIYWITIGV